MGGRGGGGGGGGRGSDSLAHRRVNDSVYGNGSSFAPPTDCLFANTDTYMISAGVSVTGFPSVFFRMRKKTPYSPHTENSLTPHTHEKHSMPKKTTEV